MKVGFVITCHQSKEHSPFGYNLCYDAIESIISFVDCPYEIVIIDNESEGGSLTEDSFSFLSRDNVHYKYIEDQSILGMTGAWNLGMKMLYDLGVDVMINSNEDIEVDDTINNFIIEIYNHKNRENGLFGPKTNIGGAAGNRSQECEKFEKNLDNSVVEFKGGPKERPDNVSYISGFFTGWSRDFYEKFRVGENIWCYDRPGRWTRWAGQEHEIYDRCFDFGMRCYVINSCFVFHKKYYKGKYRSWLNRHMKIINDNNGD
tara:strand:+ start:3781 stop:4560 length:780 start_codon:yes stop_codon:yes gene_type:complete